MAAKVPDNVTTPPCVRYSVGQLSLFVLNFITATLDDTDTIDVSSLLTSVIGAWIQCTTKNNTSAPGIAMSGTGNTTLTVGSAVNGLAYQVFVIGTP